MSMLKLKYLKPIFQTPESMARYYKSCILHSCYKYNIDPLEWAERADSDMFHKIGSLLGKTRLIQEKDLYEHLKIKYDKGEKIKPFTNEDEEVYFYQSVVLSTCINNNQSIKELEFTRPPEDDIAYEPNLTYAVFHLNRKNEPLLPKEWEKELNKYLIIAKNQ